MKKVKRGDILKDQNGKIWYYAGLDHMDYGGIPCIRLTYCKEDCKKPYANTTGRFSQIILIENGYDHVFRRNNSKATGLNVLRISEGA